VRGADRPFSNAAAIADGITTFWREHPGAFDRLAKRQHADVRRRLVLPDKVDVRLDEWRAVVERMLVEALAETGAPDAERNRVLA